MTEELINNLHTAMLERFPQEPINPPGPPPPPLPEKTVVQADGDGLIHFSDRLPAPGQRIYFRTRSGLVTGIGVWNQLGGVTVEGQLLAQVNLRDWAPLERRSS